MKPSMQTMTAVVTLGSALLAGGCRTVLSEQAFVQDAVVNAPAGQIPIRLALDVQPGHLTVSPMLSMGRREIIDGRVDNHTDVNARGTYAVDTIRNPNGTLEFVPGANTSPYTGLNLHWRTPSLTAGLGLDLPLSHSFAFSGGITYSQGDSKDLWGGHFGIALLSEGPVLGMRVDAGMQWIPVVYSVASVVETVYKPAFSSTQYTRTGFFRDDGNKSPLGWYAGLTLNTRVPSWPVQPFVNFSLSKQRFFSFAPAARDPLTSLFIFPPVQDAEVEASATLMLFSPGLSVPVGPSQRILLGARMAFLPGWIGSDNSLASTQGPVIMPFLQVDIGL